MVVALIRCGEMSRIRVSEAFSPYLGGRFRRNGPWSGEQFREELLRPALEASLIDGESVVVVFDKGMAGIPGSFLEEAFGGLARSVNLDAARLLELVKIEVERPAFWPSAELAERYLRNASTPASK